MNPTLDSYEAKVSQAEQLAKNEAIATNKKLKKELFTLTQELEEEEKILAKSILEKSGKDILQQLQQRKLEAIKDIDFSDIKEELTNLKHTTTETVDNGIVSTTTTTEVIDGDDVTEEKKGSWDKTKERRNKMSTGGKVLTSGIVVGGAILLWKGVKSIFSSKEEDTEKKKSFRESTTGKIVKWTGIGSAAYYVSHGLATGKRGLGDLLDWDNKNADGNDSPENQVESYEELQKENPEKVEKYELLGDNVDKLYTKMYGPELRAGREDDANMSTLAQKVSNGERQYTGVVPFCLDNQFKNTDRLLSERGQIEAAVSNKLKGMREYLKGRGEDGLKFFAQTALSGLPSWTKYLTGTGTWEEKIGKWIVDYGSEAETNMAFFFRQSMRVQTYLLQKKDQLMLQIAYEKTGIKDEDKLRNKIHDEERFANNIAQDSRYVNFSNGTIAEATAILKQESMLDDTIGETLQGSVDALDRQRATILIEKNKKDIVVRGKESLTANGKLSEEETQDTITACDNVIKDIDDEIIDVVEESAHNIYGDLLNTDDAAMRKYFDGSKFRPLFDEAKNTINEAKGKLRAGKLTSKQTRDLLDSLNNMMALKKEAIIGRETIQKEIDENGNIIYRIPSFLQGSLKNFFVTGLRKAGSGIVHGDMEEIIGGLENIGSGWLGTGITITIIGGVIWIKSGFKNATLIKTGIKMNTLPIYWLGKQANKFEVVRNLGNKVKYGSTSRLHMQTFWRGEAGPDKLMKLLRTGDINIEMAESIIRKKCKPGRGISGNQAWMDSFNISRTMKASEINFREKILVELIGEQDEYWKSLSESAHYDEILKNLDDPKIMDQILNKKPVTSIMQEINKINAVVAPALSPSISTAPKTLGVGLEVISANGKRGKIIAEINGQFQVRYEGGGTILTKAETLTPLDHTTLGIGSDVISTNGKRGRIIAEINGQFQVKYENGGTILTKAETLTNITGFTDNQRTLTTTVINEIGDLNRITYGDGAAKAQRIASIKKLESFTKEISSLDDAAIKGIRSLADMGMKPRYVASMIETGVDIKGFIKTLEAQKGLNSLDDVVRQSLKINGGEAFLKQFDNVNFSKFAHIFDETVEVGKIAKIGSHLDEFVKVLKAIT